MSQLAPDGTRWRGWQAASGDDRDVTSARLGTAAGVSNRWFPKTRSWFALGSPLQLLSPLSVLRVVFALAVFTWPILGYGLGVRGTNTVALGAAIGVMATIWVALFRIKVASIVACQILLLVASLATAMAVASGHGDEVALRFVPFLLATGVGAGLFLDARSVLLNAGVSTLALWAAMAPWQGSGRAAEVAVPAGFGLIFASISVQFLTASARRQSTLDPDTGLPNGLGLADIVARNPDLFSTYIVAVTQLAGLGEARDALGYRIGSELVRRAVEDMGQVLPANTVIGRVEGDQVVVLLPLDAIEDRQDSLVPATDISEDLAHTLGRGIDAGRYLVGGIEVFLRAHVGLALAPWDGSDVTELERCASLAARQAETAGHAFRAWSGSKGTMTADDLAVLTELRVAADRGELWLAYQPQIATSTGSTVAVEALLRWDCASRGPISPGVFIPLAERTGLIGRLTEWVLAEALDAQVRWRRQGLDLPVSVNLSAKTLTRPDLADWIVAELAVRDLPPSSLTLEVTETAECTDLLEAVYLLLPLREQGVRISIDDFGTGYTSLAILPQLPLDELKVDQGFVFRSAVSPPDEAIVRSVRDLAHRLGLDAVAEGVEDEDTAERMTAYGFDLLQGYYFARPMAEVDLMAYIPGKGVPRIPTPRLAS